MTETIKDLSVLIVENSLSALNQMKSMLSQLNVTQVFTAKDGEEALAFLGGEGDALDLVLCDWNIREPSGIDLLRYVRKEAPELLFIMVTGARDLDTVIEARKAGATAYIVKPYSLDELRRKLSHVLAIRRIQEEVA